MTSTGSLGSDGPVQPGLAARAFAIIYWAGREEEDVSTTDKPAFSLQDECQLSASGQ